MDDGELYKRPMAVDAVLSILDREQARVGAKRSSRAGIDSSVRLQILIPDAMFSSDVQNFIDARRPSCQTQQRSLCSNAHALGFSRLVFARLLCPPPRKPINHDHSEQNCRCRSTTTCIASVIFQADALDPSWMSSAATLSHHIPRSCGARRRRERSEEVTLRKFGFGHPRFQGANGELATLQNRVLPPGPTTLIFHKFCRTAWCLTSEPWTPQGSLGIHGCQWSIDPEHCDGLMRHECQGIPSDLSRRSGGLVAFARRLS